MDPLVQLVDLLRPRTLLWKRVEAAGDWALAFAGTPGLVFGTILSGECLLRRGSARRLRLEVGDFLLLNKPAKFTLASDPRVTAVDAERAFTNLPDKHLRIGQGQGGPTTEIMGGDFVCDAINADLLAGLLPELIHLRAKDTSTNKVRALLAMSAEETRADLPGSALVVSRLMEVILIEALRQVPILGGSGSRGLLAGLADPPLAVTLRALHERIAHRWTVAELARRAGMSRSVFALRFNEAVGQAPMNYLLSWRMAVAKDLLARGGRSLTEVAEIVGYQSASAFSTAFRRRIGCAPGGYGRSRLRNHAF